MFTSMDKALVAVVMGVLSIMSIAFGIDFGFSEAQVASFMAIVTPILVYLIPNRQA